MKLNISIDLDGVLADFYSPYLERFGNPKNDFEITLETGTYKVPEIVFKSGNSFVFDGEGTVVFEYRAEVF